MMEKRERLLEEDGVSVSGKKVLVSGNSEGVFEGENGVSVKGTVFENGEGVSVSVSDEERRLFSVVGILDRPEDEQQKALKARKRFPVISVGVIVLLILGCVLAPLLATKDPSYLDLMNYTKAPDAEFLFGTDTLGRDIFSCIWYGGRISLFVGFFSTVISTVIAVVYGAVSGIAPKWVDTLMMRLTEILLSVPGLLIIIFIQAVLGEATVLSLSVVIGITSWFSIAKVIRTEVRQIRDSGYVVASRCMGGGFFHILIHHLLPNFVSAIMFMVVMNIRSAIVSESTLSFMGIGLPLEVISWGSMLSLSEKALMTGAWWIIFIPGAFLTVLLVCMTNVGNYIRK